MGQKEGEGRAMQTCHTMVFSGVKEPVRSILVENKQTNLKPFYLEALVWKFVNDINVGEEFSVLEEFFPLFHILH